MTKICCNASNCGFNQDKTCHKKIVKIEGLFSRSKLGTFCQSFRNPIDDSLFKEEMADEITLENSTVRVLCNATYCIYNNDNYCKASHIEVGGKSAKYRSETQCDSFDLK